MKIHSEITKLYETKLFSILLREYSSSHNIAAYDPTVGMREAFSESDKIYNSSRELDNLGNIGWLPGATEI